MDLLPDRMDADAPIFVISVAAQLAEMHPQTLRGYDRLGLVVPGRARGRGRRYSLRDIAKLRHIQHLSQNEGINLEGVRRILALESELDGLRGQVARLAQVVTELQLIPEGVRLFTAEAGGSVHIGRTPRQRPLALERGARRTEA
ncbi:MAG TPA: MerR family transcriptional regulator [Propionicimonas sp.]|jgi:MerR family transcriptional regulator/heat shock protein HspR|uniref:heat shock protein transcriptional repressor HspR n=1 Tax=Propionicimonas sp. TaxID=1955623 RepID=UPI002F3E4A22